MPQHLNLLGRHCTGRWHVLQVKRIESDVNNSVCTAALSAPSTFPEEYEYGKRGGFNLHQSSSNPAKLFDFMYQCLANCPTPDLKVAFPNEITWNNNSCWPLRWPTDPYMGNKLSARTVFLLSATGEPRWVYVQGTWSSIVLLHLFRLVSKLCPFWPKVNRCAGLVYLVCFSWRCCRRQDSWTLLKPLLYRTGLEELTSQRFAKTYQATFAPQSWCKKSFSRNSFWKQLAWEAQSPTANSLRLPASAFAYSHGHHGPWWRTKPQTNLKLVHSFSFSSPRTHKNLGLACLPSMPAELCSFQFAEPAPEHQSLKSSTQGED